jgi:hypothetical protein
MVEKKDDNITTSYTATTISVMVRSIEYFAYFAKLIWEKYIEILANKEYNHIINNHTNYSLDEIKENSIFNSPDDRYYNDLF